MKSAVHTERTGLDTTDLSSVAMSAAFMAVCSWISVPASVPFTMQTFAVFATTGVLGGRRGTYSVLLYLLLGVAGLPVFAGFTGGVGKLFGQISAQQAERYASVSASYISDSSAVLEEMQSMGKRIDALGEAITNMQIVLDSGTLVGATSAKMDARLGVLAARKGRGN